MKPHSHPPAGTFSPSRRGEGIFAADSVSIFRAPRVTGAGARGGIAG